MSGELDGVHGRQAARDGLPPAVCSMPPRAYGSARVGAARARKLRTRGIGHEYRVTPGGHDGDYWRQHAAEYLRFYAAALLAP